MPTTTLATFYRPAFTLVLYATAALGTVVGTTALWSHLADALAVADVVTAVLLAF